jgi:ABC-type multidrug transport system permease subunit
MMAAADQAYLLARRSVVRTVRQPANIIAPVVFPLMLLAVNSAGLRAETHIPGFPTGSIVAFILAVPFIQGALFATMNTGTDFARDIQTGFLSRLSLTPMRGVVLLIGQLGGTITLGLFQAIVYVAVGLVIGVRFACCSRSSSSSFLRSVRSGSLRRCGPARARRYRDCSRRSSSSCSSPRWRFRAT